MFVGTAFVITVNQRVMQIVIGVLILALVTYTLFKKQAGLTETKVYPRLRQRVAYLFAPVLGFYEAIFGSGNGIMFAIVTLKTKGFDFVDALGYYYAVCFPWEIVASILFISKGYFDWNVMLPTILGSIIGGFIGSKYAKYKGNKFIKIMFVSIGTVLGVKLLLGL